MSGDSPRVSSSHAALWLGLSLTVMLGSLWLESQRRSLRQFERAQRSERAGHIELALDQYQRAMRAYAPLSQTPHQARAELNRHLSEALERGDTERALGVLMRLRGAAWSTKGLTTPFSIDQAARAQLAELFTQRERSHRQRSGEAPMSAERYGDYLRALEADPRPPLSLSLLLALGLGLSALSALLLIWRGFDAELKPSPSAQRWALSFVLGTCLWGAALWMMPA